jgi:hypothetical protein
MERGAKINGADVKRLTRSPHPSPKLLPHLQAQYLRRSHQNQLTMPEGPSILILKEKVQQFKGDKVIAASCNNGTLDTDMLTDQTYYRL